MINSTSHQSDPAFLPEPVKQYVEATNAFDLEALMSIFAENALVNDQLCDHWGKAEIRRWAERDILGECLTMKVTNVVDHNGNVVVTAQVDGNFDKRGLPDPLILAFYFTVRSNRITQLIILRNRTDI